MKKTFNIETNILDQKQIIDSIGLIGASLFAMELDLSTDHIVERMAEIKEQLQKIDAIQQPIWKQVCEQQATHTLHP